MPPGRRGRDMIEKSRKDVLLLKRHPIESTMMDVPISDFVRAGTLDELKVLGRRVVRGRHRPILLVYDGGRVFALDNRCPQIGFPLDRGSIEDGMLTCHWHHARLASPKKGARPHIQ